MTTPLPEEKNMKQKYFILYLAYLVWNLHGEVDSHMEIAARGSKKQFSKHFDVHLCDIRTMETFMQVIKVWFPEMYQESGKSIQKHYEEAKEILDKHYFGKSYKKLI